MSGAVIDVTDERFNTEIEQHRGVALVDFWSTGCAPCRRLGPIVNELAIEFKDKVKIAKIDIEDAPDITVRFGIRSIPALLLFKDGQLIDQQQRGNTADSKAHGDVR